MSEEFKIIAITRPDTYNNEADIINDLLQNNKADFVHIRKPLYPKQEIINLIEKIDVRFHNRLKLHDHFDILTIYPELGINLNSRNPVNYVNTSKISASFHNLGELDYKDNLEYFFISPIFDSISKPGYKSAFNFEILSKKIKGKKAIALGGVTPDKFLQLKEMGFIGAALLSYFFPKN